MLSDQVVAASCSRMSPEAEVDTMQVGDPL